MKENNEFKEEILKYILVFLVAVIAFIPFIPYILKFISPIFLNLIPNFNPDCIRNFISDDGRLGYYGGFFGSIIAIGGVWWQTNRTIKDEKELMFSQKRPYIILQELNSGRVNEVYGIAECTCDPEFKVLAIKNLSNQPMFSIKVVLDNEQDNPIIIDRIDKNKSIGIIVNSADVKKVQELKEEIKEDFQDWNFANFKTKKEKYNKDYFKLKEIFKKYEELNFEELNLMKVAEKAEDNVHKNKYVIHDDSLDKIDKSCIQITREIRINVVTIYFTTTVREKVKLVFKNENGKYRYQKEQTKLENKGGVIEEKEYDTADMYESYKIK